MGVGVRGGGGGGQQGDEELHHTRPRHRGEARETAAIPTTANTSQDTTSTVSQGAR